MSRPFFRLLAVFVSALAFAFALPLSLSFVPNAHGESIEEVFQQANKLLDEKNYTEAFALFHQAAEQGHAKAQSSLGVIYELGLDVPKNASLAAEWYHKAAEQGDAEAQNNLGSLYDYGKGVEQNYTQAALWYRKAVEQGVFLWALHRLAFLYTNGYGVKKDLLTAYALFSLATKKGDKIARVGRNGIAMKLTAGQITVAKKIANDWEQRIKNNKQKNQ